MSLYSFCLYMYIDLMNSNKNLLTKKKIYNTISNTIHREDNDNLQRGFQDLSNDT